jgi:phosphoglycolate phosphatase-like HAD superfamily hydrolase
VLLRKAGVSEAEIDARAEAVREECCRAYLARAPEDLSHTVLPGAQGLLAELAQRHDVIIALLTGNFEPVARRKLSAAGIGAFFAPGQGAFGSDSEARPELPAVARRRAGAPGAPHPREQTVVIGDTPRDIACARADGARCVAVASGTFGVAELQAADRVAKDMEAARDLLVTELG